MKKYDVTETGKRIRELRIAAGLTQEALAGKVGVYSKYFVHVESGRKACSVDIYVELANVLNVSLDYLITGENSDSDQLQERINRAIAILSAKNT